MGRSLHGGRTLAHIHGGAGLVQVICVEMDTPREELRGDIRFDAGEARRVQGGPVLGGKG